MNERRPYQRMRIGARGPALATDPLAAWWYRSELRAPIEHRRAMSDELLGMVNAVAESPLTEADVYIRSGIVCNDLVDHYSTRFTSRALQQIVDLWNDPATAPNWQRQHDQWSAVGGLPIGRGLRAALEPLETGGTGVRAWWYYLRNDEVGDQCERYIAAQIWRELSLAWWMKSYTCDVDGKDVEESDFYPGQELSDGRIVVGIMDDVTELAEFSLVSRGGQVGTTIETADAGSATVAGAVASDRARWVRTQSRDPLREWWYNAATPQKGATR